MSENASGAPGTPDPKPADPAAQPSSDRSINQQAKDLKWVQESLAENVDLRAKTAAYERADAEREEAKTKAERDATEKKLADEGKWDEAKKLHTDELAKRDATYAKKLLDLELKTELVGVGFKSKKWLKGAVDDYDAETHGTPEAYAETLSKDESEAAYLSTAENGRTVHKGPAPAVVAGSEGEQVSVDMMLKLEKSDKREDRIKGRELLRKYREIHGNYPKPGD